MPLKINRVPDSLKELSMYQVWSKSIEGLRKDGRKDGKMDGSVTISIRNFVGEGIIKLRNR